MDVFIQAFPAGPGAAGGVFSTCAEGRSRREVSVWVWRLCLEAVAAPCVSHLLMSPGGRGAALCCWTMPLVLPHPSDGETGAPLLPMPAVSRGRSPLSPILSLAPLPCAITIFLPVSMALLG